MRGHERNKHNLQNSLRKSRDNAEENFKEVFQTAVDLGVKSDTQPAIPWLCGRQTQRSNIPANDPMSYFRASSFIPFLDCMIQGLIGPTDRFTPIQNDIALASLLLYHQLYLKQKTTLLSKKSWRQFRQLFQTCHHIVVFILIAGDEVDVIRRDRP